MLPHKSQELLLGTAGKSSTIRQSLNSGSKLYTGMTMNYFGRFVACIALSSMLFAIPGCSNPIFKGLGNADRASSLNQLNWELSYQSAIERSQQTGKPILANFTGSDWCHWCTKLHQDVFDHPEFADWASDNVVLLELDFPQRQAQDKETKAQNKALADQFAINSYPTVLLIDSDGIEIGRLGYVAGGPEKWIEEAEAQLIR